MKRNKKINTMSDKRVQIRFELNWLRLGKEPKRKRPTFMQFSGRLYLFFDFLREYNAHTNIRFGKKMK